MSSTNEQAVKIFKTRGGTLRTGEAIKAGIHPRTLYAMRDTGELEQLARGVYRLAELPPLSNPDLATVSKRVPQGVVCLISALSFHELTTQIPHVVHLALPRNRWEPKLEYPPIQVYRFSADTYKAGVEIHSIEGVDVHIFDAEKTLADCFKYRNKIGLDVALEALTDCRRQNKCSNDELWYYAKICRVSNVMRPYMEAIG